MTIDKAIEIINHYLDYPKEEVRKALLLAIDTMCKYQKIKETINKWCADKTWEFDTSYLYEIMEIIDNGNDD